MGTRDPVSGILRAFRRIKRIPVTLARNGFTHSIHLIYVCLVLPVSIKVLPTFLRLYRKAKKLKQSHNVNKELHHWQSNKKELLRSGKRGYRLAIEDLGLDQEKFELLKKKQRLHEVVIAEIDQDGFLLSHFGSIRDTPTISEEQFLKRKRFRLKVVAIDGQVGVKKDYSGDKLSFVNEIKALHHLGIAGCNVPAIIDVDFDALTLTLSFILGPVLREELAKRGAILRDCDVDNNPDYAHLTPKERQLKCIQEGKRVLYDVIDSQFVENLFTQLSKVHAYGFILDDIKYGNIIIEKGSGEPYLIDFDFATDYPKLGKTAFRILCDQDIEKFNLLFDIEKLTYKSIKEKIKNRTIVPTNDWWYAPVYFGAGLRIGSIWSVDTGYGRWNYILKHNLPPLAGKRILDLGANNAFISIQMLRHGAREAIGIELDSKYIAQGKFVKAVFEWADNTPYDFRYIQADMAELPELHLGEFDMVIALCSLYYLDDKSISDLIQYISTVTNIFVLQCNIDTNIERKFSCAYRKASVEYTVKALRCNGFPATRVVAPFRYSRPLVIGRKEDE